MKRALSVATVTALSILVFLFVGYAQEEGAEAVSALLEQELVAMESAFGSLEAFMGELISEVKGNMGDIDSFNAKLDDYRDIIEAVSVEIKDVEGKIIGLRADVDALGETHQELMVRMVALEAGLSELAAFCDELNALRDSIYADLLFFQETFTADLTFVQAHVEDLSLRVLALEEEDVGTFKKKVIELERSMAAIAIRVENNRTKLEGFDFAIASISEEMATTREGILESNQALLSEFDTRLIALEDGTDLQSQIDTLFFISIIALLSGVGALIWGFLGN